MGETAGYGWGVKRPKQRKQPQEARPALPEQGGQPAPPSQQPRPGGPAREEIRADPKQVWMKRLTQEEEEWKAALRAQPRRVLGQFPPLELDEGAPWSRCEFERSDLPDRRLWERLLTIGEPWEHKPGQCLPDLFPSGALQQGAYRFLDNDRVSMEDVLQPRREALAERCVQLPGTVLLVQDTTTLNLRCQQLRGLLSVLGRDRPLSGATMMVGQSGKSKWTSGAAWPRSEAAILPPGR